MTVTLNEPQGGFDFVKPTELISKPAGGVVAFEAPKAVVLGPVMGRGEPGLQGPVGPTGPAGPPGGATMLFSFPVASTTWNLPHNFGSSEVVVVTRDNSGVEIYGDVLLVDTNNAQVSWYYPTSGSCRVSA